MDNDAEPIGDDTILFRRLYPAQAGPGEDGPKSVVSSNAYKVSKKVLQEISVEIAGLMTQKGPMTAELCAFWNNRPQCGAGRLHCGEVRALGFKVTHTVLPGESEAHALLEAIDGEVTPVMIKDLASITRVVIPPDDNRREVPPLDA